MIELLYVADLTTFSDATAVKDILYKECTHLCTKNNSRHFSLSFRSGTSLEEMPPLLNRFLEKLIETSGIHPSRLGVVGLLMTRPDSHGHLVCISDKNKQTGRSIANMPLTAIQSLFDWWEGIAGSNVKSRAVYDAYGLAEYHTGWVNMLHPGQKWGMLSVHGQSFINRLNKRKEKRLASCQDI